ncbi:MAG: TetR/AcrR family transcriptional regulator [Halobacteriales archaeon]
MTDQSVRMGEAEVETKEAIMAATYRAVCTHGFADVTMQDIADEFDKSKSLLHYHFDTKEDLLLAFLHHLVDEFEANLASLLERPIPPEDRLREYLEWFAVEPEEAERTSLHLALLELRSQAQRNPRFREPFRRSDRLGRAAFADILEEGQGTGRFDAEVDVEALARLCYATMDGARARQLTLGEPGYAATVAETLHGLLLDRLEPDAP